MKLKKIIYITLVCVFITYLCMMFFNCEVKYDLTDCVRYFDNEGRYRLMLVTDTYFFVDAKKEYGQKANIIQYCYDEDVFYGIYLFKNQTTYFVFNIKTGAINEYSNINLVPQSEKSVFTGTNMIQLDKPNKYKRYFRKFIPLKFRKK